VQSFEELQANKGRVAGDQPGMVREAIDAGIEIYHAWGKPEKVAEWRKKLDALPSPQR
jgi:hypothetical protein